MSFWVKLADVIKCVGPKLRALFAGDGRRRHHDDEDLKRREIFREMVKNHQRTLEAQNEMIEQMKGTIDFLKKRVLHLEEILKAEEIKCNKRIEALAAEISDLRGKVRT